MKHYFSDGTWFDKETESHFICMSNEFDDGTKAGIFRGLRNGKWDEEACMFDEFRIEEDQYGD